MTASNALLVLSHVSKKFGARKALNDISLTIFEGEIIGLLGVNGAGKTTLSSIIASLIPASDGTILYQGKSIYDQLAAYRSIIGYCPQKPNLNGSLTVRQNLERTAAYFGIPAPEAKQKIEQLIEQFQLGTYQHECPFVLSGGYKQRVVIARALLTNPKLVILDEPTVGLDPHIRHQLWEIIRDLKKLNIAVVLTTHYLDEAEVLSDRICILDHGDIKMIDTPANLKSTYAKSNLESVFLQIMNEEAR
ncbi:ABC transporter ATP-binding protein [Candidatus Dependentiae bacterium]|nr:ABC transporter ATP-binding protein [Candidatus Dependentiae bacterium]